MNKTIKKTIEQMTIMVVDDSTMIQKIIQRELEAAGYTVITFGDGMEAMSALSWMDMPPDLITLDIDMPKMDGFSACEYLRKKEAEGCFEKTSAGPIPVLFVSANDTDDNRRRGYELGSLNFIAKPFTPGDILAAVNDVFGLRGQYAEMITLVIDDSRVVRHMIGCCLRVLGADYLEAGNGKNALEIIHQQINRIDLLIVDYRMPGMQGDELVAKLRAIEGGARIPVLFVSAAGNIQDILAMYRAGGSDYIQKPFIAEELQARIKVHFEARKYMRELEKLNKNLYNVAVYDALTKLHNKRYLMDNLDRAFSIAIRQGDELCCLFFDLDFFKKVNDNCGHPFGDYVLREIGSLVKRNIRSSDLAVRYGGEEFVIAMPQTPLTDALTFAERLRQIVDAHTFKDNDYQWPVTISIGIASLQEHSPSGAINILHLADKALYRAKESGRNKVVVYQP